MMRICEIQTRQTGIKNLKKKQSENQIPLNFSTRQWESHLKMREVKLTDKAFKPNYQAGLEDGDNLLYTLCS